MQLFTDAVFQPDVTYFADRLLAFALIAFHCVVLPFNFRPDTNRLSTLGYQLRQCPPLARRLVFGQNNQSHQR